MTIKKVMYNGIEWERTDIDRSVSSILGMYRNIEHGLLSIYVWEQYNGKFPEGYDIIHRDGDVCNCDISNLEYSLMKPLGIGERILFCCTIAIIGLIALPFYALNKAQNIPDFVKDTSHFNTLKHNYFDPSGNVYV